MLKHFLIRTVSLLVLNLINKLVYKALNRAQMSFTTVVPKLNQGTPENGRSRCGEQRDEAIRRLFCFFFGEATKEK